MSFRIFVPTLILVHLAACSTLDSDPNTDPDDTDGAATTSGTTSDGSGVDQPTTSTTADPSSGTTGSGPTAPTTDGPDTDGTGTTTDGTTDGTGTDGTIGTTTGTTADDTAATTTEDTAGTTTDDTTGTITGTTTDDITGTTTDDTTTDGVGFPDDAVFVHIGVGLDSNPGTQDAPKRTIQAGIAAAVMAGAGAVYIAEGTYDVDYQDNKVITLQDGVSLFGGYKADDWGDRDPGLYPSLIVDKSTTGGSASQPNRAVDGGTGVGPDTVVDGLTIQGGTGDHATAVFIDGSNPTLTGNVLLGGAAADLYSYGLSVREASPTIKHNRIQGGEHEHLTNATGAYFLASSAHVEGNIIHAGFSWRARGVQIISSDLVLYNNVIDGGTWPDLSPKPALASYAHAVSVSGGAPTVAGNTLMTSSALKGVGVYLANDAAPKIDGNIITRAARCVRNNNTSHKAASLRNNAFNCTQAYEHDDTTYNELLPLETLLSAEGTLASGNVKVAPTFVQGGTYHLEPGGETSCVLAQGGLDQSPLFTTDHDGAPRTVPWTIGAFELDGPCM